MSVRGKVWEGLDFAASTAAVILMYAIHVSIFQDARWATCCN